MSYSANVFRILIASPSDVREERDIISHVIQEWNDLYSYEKKVVLLPLRWETHASPELGARPQDIINREVVDLCDMAIGVFWTRIGTPTGKAEGGTVEEIERVGNKGKIVMLYFSKAKVDLDNIDFEQYNKLKAFKNKTCPNGLVESYIDLVDFRSKLAKQLEIKVRSLASQAKEDGDNQVVNSSPKIEIGFINVETSEFLNNEIAISSKILQLKDTDIIPDFRPLKKNEAKSDEKGKYIIVGVNNGSGRTNRNYYREYIDFL